MIKTTPRTDEELILAYGRGDDRRALEALVERHFGPAYRLALGMLGDPGAAEDAAEAAFVGLIRGARRFEEGRAFSPWFSTLVLNAARKEARSRRRRVHHERAARKEHAVAPDASLERSDVEARVLELPLDVREPLVLHYYEGRSHEEVALILGCPKGTASSRIRRGLEQLRESLVGAGFGAAALAPLDVILRDQGGSGPVPGPPAVARLESAAARARLAALLSKAGVFAVFAGVATTTALAFTPASNPQGAPPSSASAIETASSALAPPPSVATTEGSVASSTTNPTEPASSGGAPAAPGAASAPVRLAIFVKDAAGAPVPGALVATEWLGPVARGPGATVMFQEPEEKARLRERLSMLSEHFRPLPEDADRTGADGALPFARKPGATFWVYAGRGEERALAGPFPGDQSAEVVLRPLATPEPGTATVLVEVASAHGQLRRAAVMLGWSLTIGDQPWGDAELSLETDAQGVIALRDVPPGRHAVGVRAPGLADGSAVVEVVADTVKRATIVLAEASVLSGRLIVPSGANVESATITARHVVESKKSFLIQDPTARIGPAGNYTIDSLSPGKWRLQASLDGFASRELEVEIARPGRTDAPDISLGVGAAVAGSVVKAEGTPVTGVSVRLEQGEREGDTTTTDVLGRFEIKGVLPGRYTVSADGAGRREVTVDTTDVDAGTFKLAPEKRNRITGRVIGADGKPVAAATVSLRVTIPRMPGAPSPPAPVLTDADGRFTFEGTAELLDGIMEIYACARKDGLISRAADVPAEGDLELALTTAPAALAGVLHAPASLLEGGVRIAADGEGGRQVAILAEDGSFQLDDLFPGESMVQLMGQRFHLTKKVVLEAGKKTTLDIPLDRATGTVSFKVSGLPATHARYALTWDEQGDLPQGFMSANDTELEQVPAASVTARASFRAGGLSVELSRDITVAARGKTIVELAWPAERATLKGSAPGASSVRLVGPGVMVEVKTDEQGRFQLEAPAGTYRIHGEAEIGDRDDPGVEVVLVNGTAQTIESVPLAK